MKKISGGMMDYDVIWRINEIFYFSWVIGMSLIIGIEFASDGENKWFEAIKVKVSK